MYIRENASRKGEQEWPAECVRFYHLTTGLLSYVCVVDCAINGFIGGQNSLPKEDALDF